MLLFDEREDRYSSDDDKDLQDGAPEAPHKPGTEEFGHVDGITLLDFDFQVIG